jgi:predicted nucleic acid-binding protein
MVLFWDSSAVLPLIFKESHSKAAMMAWQRGRIHLAWEWMEVETHAALVRRTYASVHLRAWRSRLDRFYLFGLPPEANRRIMACNQQWALRSADAAHLFLFQELRNEFPEIQLVTFDGEMINLARKEGWRLRAVT